MSVTAQAVSPRQKRHLGCQGMLAWRVQPTHLTPAYLCMATRTHQVLKVLETVADTGSSTKVMMRPVQLTPGT